MFSLTKDRGYGEFFQYTKELWIAVLFFLLGLKQRKSLYFIFSLLFLYFLIDDSFEFHERFGAFLAGFFSIQPLLGLRPVDLGELAVSAFFGVLFIPMLGIFYYWSDRSTRTVSIYVILMVVVLGLFGVVLDLVEVTVARPTFSYSLRIIEEGGEMVVMSFITWFVFRLSLNSDQIPLSFLATKKVAVDPRKD